MQKEIINASLLKQPWFFYKIIEKYIKFTEILIKSKCDNKSLQLTTFQVENYDLKLIAPTCSYRIIEIKSNIGRYHMIGCCIEILTHLLDIDLDYNKSIGTEITLRVLEALNSCSFRIKLKCFEYFLRFFEINQIKDGEVSETAFLILCGINSIFDSVELWETTEVVNKNEIIEFLEIIPKILNKMKYSDETIDLERHKKIVNLMILLLKKCQDPKICDALINFLEDVFHKIPIDVEICLQLSHLIPKLPKHPNCMKLLAFCFWDEKLKHLEILLKTQKMLSSENFNDLKKFEAILNSTENDHLTLQSNLNVFLGKIKQQLRSSNKTTIQELNIIKYLISGDLIESFDKTYKLEIFDILFNSFSTQIKSIEIILTLEVSDQKILNRISKILSTILTSDTKTDIKNYLIENSSNFLINNLCSKEDFLQNILEPAWNGVENHRSLSSVLDKIICIFCNEVNVEEINENGRIVYRIECRICNNSEKESTERESVFEQSDLKDFVKNVLTLLRCDNKVIKTNMFKCLVNYFNHFGFDFDLEIWISFFVDKDLEIREEFSKIISPIFRAIQVSFIGFACFRLY